MTGVEERRDVASVAFADVEVGHARAGRDLLRVADPMLHVRRVIREMPGTDFAKAVAERAAPEPPVPLPIEDGLSTDEPSAAPRTSGRQRRLFDEDQ